MTIQNLEAKPQRIVDASSDGFGRGEIHESLMQDGMMRMERRMELVVEPGATLMLEPGGLHLMLMMPKQPLKPGDRIRLELELGDGTRQQIEMTVKK